jgi:hypothetical protein
MYDSALHVVIRVPDDVDQLLRDFADDIALISSTQQQMQEKHPF